jgi:AsmA protein
VQLAVRAGDPRALIEGRASPLAATLASEALRTDFTGRAGTSPRILDGGLSIAVPSITRLSHWFGTPIDLTGPAAFAMSGTIIARNAKATLTAERVALDDASGRGELTVDVSGAKPFVRTMLELGALDLTPYVPPRAEPVELAPPAGPATWSAAPIDIAFLRTFNGDLQLTVSNLRVRDVRIGRTQLNAQLRDGRMVAEIAETTLYRGRGRGRGVFDASGAVPAVEANLKFAGLHAASLLTDIAGTDRFAGIGALDLSLVGRGRSPRELVANLGGEGEFRIYDGAIKGVDLAALAREPGRAYSDEKISDTRQTDFAELTGTLSINSGIVRNFDLMLKSPLLRVEGAGAIDLPQRRLRYRLLPKSIVSLDGTAADGALVPVVVEGPWDDLAYRPDPTVLPSVDSDKLPAQRGPAPSPRTLQQPGPAPAAGSLPRPLELRRGTVR